MNLEIGKAANKGYGACGHEVAEGERVLIFTHDQRKGFVCQRKPCSLPFFDADTKLDGLKAVDAGAHGAVHAAAETAASDAGAEEQSAWDAIDRGVVALEEPIAEAKAALDQAAAARDAAEEAHERARWEAARLRPADPGPESAALVTAADAVALVVEGTLAAAVHAKAVEAHELAARALEEAARAHDRAEHQHRAAIADHALAVRKRDHHHSRSRTPAFAAACAWLHVVRSA